MRPERFVTLCFLYSGLILLAQYVVIYQLQLNLAGLSQLGVGISILAAGFIRVWNPEAENQNPAKWGLFTYGMAILSLFLTGIFIAQLALSNIL